MGSLIEARRRVLLETPHLETASGARVIFRSPGAVPLEELRVDFAPVQAGSGDPSPTNVRPISGRTELEVRLSHTAAGGEVIGLSWSPIAGTVYGGYVDLVSGELVATHKILTLDTSQMNNDEDKWPGWRDCGVVDIVGKGLNIRWRNMLLNVGHSVAINTSGSSSANRDVLCLWNSDYGLTQSEWIAKAMNIQIVLPLVTPIRYQLTPQQIKSLRGVNNIWSDAGDVTVKYWTH